jgi:signal peptidase I
MATVLAKTNVAARWLWSWTRSLVVALFVWFLISTFLVQAFRITSGSMERTVLVGDFLFVNKLLYGAEVPLAHRHLPPIREPAHDEVVVVKSPIEDLVLLKRIVGLPGDTIGMSDGHLVRNGTIITEPYVTLHPTPPGIDSMTRERMRQWQTPYLLAPAPRAYRPDARNWGPLLVPRRSLFAMGDNRDDSFDSRFYGFIPRENLRGSPLFIYYSYDPTSWRLLPFLTAIRWDRALTRPFRTP